MNYPKIPEALQLIQLCNLKGINHVVISPGSRNAPLTIGFASHPLIKTYSVVDERCAAFFALGMAQQLQQPVAVVCTSGSALLNYYPAIAEAFYSDVPLVVISADRPKHLIDIGDGQTLRQENVFEKHILFSANLKQGAQNNQDLINKAINCALSQSGPVHINIPFAEPLYEAQEELSEKITVLDSEFEENEINQQAFEAFAARWKSSKKRMILIGVNQPNKIEQKYLDFLGIENATLVFTESTSNIHHANFLPSIDKIIAPLSEEGFKNLQPDVLLTIGGMVVSKKIKVFLRTYAPKAHYHIGTAKALDTYFCLTHHFNVDENTFFEALTTINSSIESDYQTKWLAVKEQRSNKHQKYLETIPFSDFKAFECILNEFPKQRILHLSNSSTVRYVQLFDNNPNIIQYCNRGTSGIDGSTSTAIGHAVLSSKQNILVTGDLSFFYDSNALWNTNIPNSFRIIVINNSGGGIFRILPGQKNTENFETYFETKHNLTAEHLSKMYGFNYTSVDDEEGLKLNLKTFFEASEQPKILEIFTPRVLNDTYLIEYFKQFNEE